MKEIKDIRKTLFYEEAGAQSAGPNERILNQDTVCPFCVPLPDGGIRETQKMEENKRSETSASVVSAHSAGTQNVVWNQQRVLPWVVCEFPLDLEREGTHARKR